jgi:valyl-tRNA synthetase
MDEKFLKPYDSTQTEDGVYELWEKSGLFDPDECIKQGITSKEAEYFSMVLPPPNVTGTLHMGSASMLALEDIMARYQRMRGKRTLWIPGTDHAAIATESKVAKILEKEEGVRKKDLGREEFLKKVNEFAESSKKTIQSQIRKMGSSVDWSREAFTLDEKRSFAVRTAFKRMYEEGLIYRNYRLVNWDPKGQTTVSDDEVEYTEGKGTLYTFKYDKDFPIPISTTRPETKVGDTAVAVHPKDDRYKEFIGKTYETNYAGVPLSIKIVGDEAIDPEFGTGAVGVTPAHSFTDWEIAKRHNLEVIKVINEYAKMEVGVESLKGKKILEARSIILEWLKEEGLLINEKEIDQNMAHAQRTGGVIEPLPKLQWFIDVNKEFVIKHSNIDGIPSGSKTTLKKLMYNSVKNGQIKILPERFEKTYFHWVENLRDWCISRQIWYGHQIPVWYKGDEIYCDTNAPKGDGWEQDPDTLDTWFSSGLWTFSTLGWPDETRDLKDYHPTTVLETGYDILFFWIARMILMSSYHLGEIPFSTVYLHGIVRDEKGNKISKSLGNNIDPVDMITKYGADAVRMSLVIGTGPGNDSKMAETKLKAYKHFANKIWNASRFVLSYTGAVDLSATPELTKIDIGILTEWNKILADITEDMERYRFYLAGEKLYHYFWHTFADVLIEESKRVFSGDNNKDIISKKWTLAYVLTSNIKALHPFMPFITEEIWQLLPKGFKPDSAILMVTKWPEPANIK